MIAIPWLLTHVLLNKSNYSLIHHFDLPISFSIIWGQSNHFYLSRVGIFDCPSAYKHCSLVHYQSLGNSKPMNYVLFKKIDNFFWPLSLSVESSFLIQLAALARAHPIHRAFYANNLQLAIHFTVPVLWFAN